MVENETNLRIMTLGMDNEGEFTSNELCDFVKNMEKKAILRS